MKKLFVGFVMAASLGLAGYSAYAACVLGSAFCADDTGQYVGGILNDGNGAGMPSRTVSQLSTTAPRVAGQEVFCSNCVAAGNQGTICISTGTGVYAYALSTGTVCK